LFHPTLLDSRSYVPPVTSGLAQQPGPPSAPQRATAPHVEATRPLPDPELLLDPQLLAEPELETAWLVEFASPPLP
jgi:hypothetical protein